MSATGRGRARNEADFYPTPPSAVTPFLRAVDLPGGAWCEPAVGDGAIVRAVESVRPSRQMWMLNDVREEAADAIVGCCDPSCIIAIETEDFLSPVPSLDGCSVYITNPPFPLAEEFAVECIRRAGLTGHVVLLLRLAFLEGQKRAAFHRENKADVYVLPKRPSFTGKGTDATAYAWFHWHPRPKRDGFGRVVVLGDTLAPEPKRPRGRLMAHEVEP